MNKSFIQIDARDNVLVALQDIAAGIMLEFKDIKILMKEFVPAKHKFFINNMQTGDEIFMYGVLVGRVENNVEQGTLMTTVNTKHAAQPYAFRDFSYQWRPPDISSFVHRTFNGFVRNDGRAGTANYWLFIPTVFCENRNLDVIK